MKTVFFVLPDPPSAPTADDLSLLSAQCSEAEWQTLVRSERFICSACENFSAAARVASELLGRNFLFSRIPNHPK